MSVPTTYIESLVSYLILPLKPRHADVPPDGECDSCEEKVRIYEPEWEPVLDALYSCLESIIYYGIID